MVQRVVRAARGAHLAKGAREEEEDKLQNDLNQARIDRNPRLRIGKVAREKCLQQMLRVAVGEETLAGEGQPSVRQQRRVDC